MCINKAYQSLQDTLTSYGELQERGPQLCPAWASSTQGFAPVSLEIQEDFDSSYMLRCKLGTTKRATSIS